MRIKVDAKQAVITERETLTVGSRGIMIGLEFSPEWDGLAKTALFWDGVGEPIPVLIFSDFVEIPAELTASNTLKPSVVFKGVASDGSVVYPAVECPLGSVWHGIRTGGYPVEPPAPDWTAQIEAAVREAVETANGVRADADAGVFHGGYYTVSATATGDKLTFTWTASDPGMEAIPPQTVALDIPGASPEEIAKAVEAYLTEHPVQAPVQSVNGKTGNVILTAEDVQADPAGAARAVADELRGEIASIVIPTKLSELTDDAQHRTVTDTEKAEWDGKQPAGDYLTEEADPTVPAWAKQPSKPTYTAEEVGALPDSTEALKNPHALTFTGAVSATYDGSKPVRVEIPVGGSGGPANASELAATVPAGLPPETEKNVQAVLEALDKKPGGGEGDLSWHPVLIKGPFNTGRIQNVNESLQDPRIFSDYFIDVYFETQGTAPYSVTLNGFDLDSPRKFGGGANPNHRYLALITNFPAESPIMFFSKHAFGENGDAESTGQVYSSCRKDEHSLFNGMFEWGSGGVQEYTNFTIHIYGRGVVNA